MSDERGSWAAPDEQKPNPARLEIDIKNTRPVDLSDLTASLLGFARSYRRFETFQSADAGPVKLYVKEIKTGSIIVELINAVPDPGVFASVALPEVIEKSKHLIDFAKYLKEAFDYFTGRGKKPEGLPAPQMKDLAQVMEPVANDPHGNISINARDNAVVFVNMNYSSIDANAIQNRVEKEIKELSTPTQRMHNKVLMYWHQASADPKSRKSDRAIIDSISDKPLRVIFPEDDVEMKRTMIAGKDNPFTKGFLVDVEVMTVQNEPVAYKVLHLYETLTDEPDLDTDLNQT